MPEPANTSTKRTDEAEKLRQQLLRMIVKNEQQRKTPVGAKKHLFK